MIRSATIAPRGRIPANELAARERALLATTRSLFLRLGYDGVSVEAIARSAHVSPKTIYARYGGKDGLFIAALKPKAEELAATLDVAPADLAQARRALSLFGERVLAISLSPGALRMHRLLVGEAARFPKLGRVFYENGPSRALAALATFFARCDESGVIACGAPETAATFYLGALQGEVLRQALLFDECPAPNARRLRAKAATEMILAAYRRS